MNLKEKLKRMQGKVNRSFNKSELGDLPLKPYSRRMGWERGTPIDRIYIEKFLEDNKKYIYGDIIEIAESTYTYKYGVEIKKAWIFTAEKITGENVIVGDLENGIGVVENLVDCFILTQTIPFIFDIKETVKSVMKLLKVGGVALVTLRGISCISQYDECRWGDYWGFTKQSAEKLFDVENAEVIKIEQYGNVKVASSFLYGLSAEELEKSDYEYVDDLYPVTIGIVVRKIK